MFIDAQIKEKERKIYSELSKNVKHFTGKGPVNTEVFIHERFVMVRLTGHMLPVEQQIASSSDGYLHAKLNRCQWFEAIAPALTKRISELIDSQVFESFYDVDPKKNISVMIFFYK